MSTNGASNGHGDDNSGVAGMFPPDLEFDLNMFIGQYVSYEQVMGTLMWACMENELVQYEMFNTLDTMSLERKFSALCVPASWEPPFKFHAKLAFDWPAEYTSLSLAGDEAFCSLYHSDDEPCTHLAKTAEPMVVLRITYYLPDDVVAQVDSDAGIEKTARLVRDIFAEVVDHDNIVQVDVKATLSDFGLHLNSMKAHHFWLLEEELKNLPALGEVFLSLAQEIQKVLLRFAAEFGGQETVE